MKKAMKSTSSLGAAALFMGVGVTPFLGDTVFVVGTTTVEKCPGDECKEVGHRFVLQFDVTHADTCATNAGNNVSIDS